MLEPIKEALGVLSIKQTAPGEYSAAIAIKGESVSLLWSASKPKRVEVLDPARVLAGKHDLYGVFIVSPQEALTILAGSLGNE
jgi:hypothetical protein